MGKTFLGTALAMMVLGVTTQTPPGGFKQRCTSDNDYGWPRFHNASDLKASTQWFSYYNAIYGTMPSDAAFPICVYDLQYLEGVPFVEAGLDKSRAIVPASAVREGDLFQPYGGGRYSPYGIYHSEWTPVPNNTWVEVNHAVYPTELAGAWVWVTQGSGIWANSGKTLVFPTPADPKETHAAAIAFLRDGCTVKISNKWPQLESDIFGLCAREKGYDSIQFEPQQGQNPVGTFNITGQTEMVFVNMDGDKGCGVANPSETKLQSGWAASQQCTCANTPIPETCGLMPKPPFPGSIFGESPPLCQARAHNRAASCNPAVCKHWTCTL